MKIWFDTEFIEDGKTIDLISLGAVREDGTRFYAENAECDLSKACDWVRANVLPHCNPTEYALGRRDLATRFRLFAGAEPEFWAYYGAYDWVVLCQLYGRMIDLPQGWPMYVRDLKQLAGKRPLLKQHSTQHHALSDALWTRQAHLQLMRLA